MTKQIVERIKIGAPVGERAATRGVGPHAN